MLVIIVGTVVVYRQAVTPYNQAREEASSLASRRADLVTVEDFYWYNGSETYFTVTGINNEDENIVVIIRQEGGQITTFNRDETISEIDAVNQVRQEKNPEKILGSRIGIEDDQAIWEVSYRNENGRIGYYVISLETGEWLRTIDNI